MTASTDKDEEEATQAELCPTEEAANSSLPVHGKDKDDRGAGITTKEEVASAGEGRRRLWAAMRHPLQMLMEHRHRTMSMRRTMRSPQMPTEAL